MACRLITLREFETLRVSDALVSAGEKALTHKEAEELLLFDESLSVRAFEHRYRSVRFLNYCGVIQVGQLTLEILPKISEPKEEGRDVQIDRLLLLRMLAVARDLPLIDTNQAGIQLQQHHLLDIVVAYFCEETFRQLHKGVIRRYETAQETLPLIRGKWLIEADLQRNIGRKDYAHCEYDEFTDDNPYNRAIKAALRLLANHTAANPHLNQKVRTLTSMLPDVADCAVEACAVARLPRNRLVSRYETVFRLCEWFLAGQSPNVHAGEERALGLLFDMNVLFEEFVAKILRSTLPNGYRLQTQGPRIYLARDTDTGDNRFQMKPDLCIVGADGAVKVIIDTKWKLVDALDAKNKYGVQQADMYQLRTYADAYRCEKVALWYPASSQINDASTLAVFEFLKIGGEPIGSIVAINALELRKQFPSGQAWKENMRSQALGLVSRLHIEDPQQKPSRYLAPYTT